MRELLDRALEMSREAERQLSKPLEELGASRQDAAPTLSLKERFERFGRDFGIETHTSLQAPLESLSRSQAAVAQRVCTEASWNAARHSGAENLWLESRLAGKDPAREPGVRRRIGYLSDEPHLYDKLTGEEHLRLHAALYGLSSEEASGRGAALIEVLCLDPRRRTGVLSLGMRKKLALVLALVHEPDLLVLDEPMNGLDPDSARMVEGLLTEHAGAVVLSTHSLDFAASFASTVAVMREGRIASLGTRKEAGSG